jgi:hypothetical protein
MSIMPASDHPSIDVIIFSLIATVAALGIASFCVTPAYQMGVHDIITTLTTALGTSIGAKYGLSQSRPYGSGAPGSATQTRLETTTTQPEAEKSTVPQ